MDASGVDRVAHERLASARVDGDVAAADGFQDAQAVLRRVFERGVAVDGADAEEVDAGRVGGEEEGEGVLEPWSDDVEGEERYEAYIVAWMRG